MTRQRGFTLIEVMIAVAILAIIYSGLMVATNKTFKGWWALRGSLDLTQKASDALYWISRDFRNAKASLMGNIASNPGLEDPQEMSSAPSGWENSIVSGGYVQRISSSDSPEVRGGVKSIQLSQNTTAYFSNVFTIPETRQYVVSGWVKAGGGTAAVKLVTGDKTTVLASTTTANNYWVHAATSSVLNTGQQIRLKLDFPSPTWRLDFTLPLGANVRDVMGLSVFQNKLYAYFGNGYELYVNETGAWGLGYTTTEGPWVGMAVHNGKLYVIYTDWPKIEVSAYDGATLSLSTGFQTSPQYTDDIYVLCSYNGALYAGGDKYNSFTGKYEPLIFKYDGVSTWNIVFTDVASGSQIIRSLCVYNDGSGDKLFAGGTATPGKIYVYDGISWIQDFNFGWNVLSLAVHNNQLYAATDAAGPSCKVYIRNAANNWVIVPALTGVMKSAKALWSHNGQLYIGGTNSFNQATIVVYDGINPPTTSFTTAADVVNSFATYKNKLYASTLWHQGGIFVLGGEDYFDDISISPVEVDTTTIAAIPYEYSSAVAQNSASGNQWRRYRLRYVPKNTPDPAAPGELYREYTLDGANWIAQGLLSSGALCDNVKSFKIINRNQESFTVELILEKEISAGVKKEYVNYTTITPIVP